MNCVLGFVLWLVEIESSRYSKNDFRCNEYPRVEGTQMLKLVATASLAVTTASMKFVVAKLLLAAASSHCFVALRCVI